MVWRSASTSLRSCASSASCTTRLTRPHLWASVAASGDAARLVILATFAPTILASFWLSPQLGRMPNAACVSLKDARGDARSMSQPSANSNPALMATPLIAPTMGKGQSSIWWTMSSSTRLSSILNTRSASRRSIPVLNARLPVAVSTTHFTDLSTRSSLKAFARARSMACVMALTVFGESMTTTATPGTDARRWTRTDIDARPASEETGGFMMKRVTRRSKITNDVRIQYILDRRFLSS